MMYSGKTTGQQSWSGDVGGDSYNPAEASGKYTAGSLGGPPPSIARKPKAERHAPNKAVTYGQDVYSLPGRTVVSVGRN
jgi:hypothetical protein